MDSARAGVEEGRVEHRGPKKRFAKTLEGIGERSKDLGSFAQELSGFIRRRREI